MALFNFGRLGFFAGSSGARVVDRSVRFSRTPGIKRETFERNGPNRFFELPEVETLCLECICGVASKCAARPAKREQTHNLWLIVI